MTPAVTTLDPALAADIAVIESIQAVPTILDVVCRVTGMGFAAVARVTEDRWIACRVHDEIGFGLAPGGELKLETTICDEIRESGTGVIIDHVAADETYSRHPAPAMYGFQSYISMPIVLPNGTFFGTLCAIDPRPARLDTPEIRGMFGMFADLLGFHIDAQRRLASAEDARRSEAFVRSLLAATPDGVAVLSVEGRLEFMNERGLELNQIASAASWLGRDVAALWPEAMRPAIAAALGRAAAGETARIEGPGPTPRGEQSWWEASFAPFQPEGGGPLKIVCISRDATERRAAGQGLRASEAALRLLNADLERRVAERTLERGRIWELSPDLLSVVDLETGLFDRVNPACVAKLGWEVAELEGTSYDARIHAHDLAASQAAFAIARGGEPVRFENRFRHRDGSDRWLSWSAVPDGGKLYARARDVTDAKLTAEALAQAEEQLRQSQKMEAVGQLTGGVAHDFNNLLTVIRSSVELLKRPDLSAVRRERYVNAISDTVDRAARLTSQLLAFARRQALRPEVFDAGASVRTIVDMVDTLTGARIKVATRLPHEACCFVNADPSQFDTALVNMAVNARDAMAGEGELTIAVEAVDAMPARGAHPGAAGAFVAVSITDTGHGISPDALERIFEPFFTTKALGQGTGLGLSQVYGFAKQSGGEIVARSEVAASGRPGGTMFTLYLPRVAAPARTIEAHEPAPLADGHGTCVLVVEDNREVGTFALQSLAELGYDAVLASDAAEALAALARDADRYDVVFSDVVMPGMSGIELAERIGRDHPGLPVVLTSGYGHALAQNGSAGFELLDKPYSVAELSRVLRGAASRPQRPRRVAASTGS